MGAGIASITCCIYEAGNARVRLPIVNGEVLNLVGNPQYNDSLLVCGDVPRWPLREEYSDGKNRKILQHLR